MKSTSNFHYFSEAAVLHALGSTRARIEFVLKSIPTIYHSPPNQQPHRSSSKYSVLIHNSTKQWVTEASGWG